MMYSNTCMKCCCEKKHLLFMAELEIAYRISNNALESLQLPSRADQGAPLVPRYIIKASHVSVYRDKIHDWLATEENKTQGGQRQ